MHLFCTLFFVCLFVFYGTSTRVGYLMPNPFYSNKQFYFKQFCLITVPVITVLMSKNSSTSKIQFTISIQFTYQNSSISSNLVSHKYAD